MSRGNLGLVSPTRSETGELCTMSSLLNELKVWVCFIFQGNSVRGPALHTNIIYVAVVPMATEPQATALYADIGYFSRQIVLTSAFVALVILPAKPHIITMWISETCFFKLSCSTHV